jgi:hypothetical protein
LQAADARGCWAAWSGNARAERRTEPPR